MKILGIIPARFKSSRYPGKPLINICGKPLVIHVAEKASEALGKENCIVATENELIAETVIKHGYRSIMTADTHKTGTDRLYEVATKEKADIYVNIQGDEPMVSPADIINIANIKNKFPDFVINGMHKLGNDEDAASVNIPKVVFSKDNNLVYMSRLAIPGIKDPVHRPVYYKQVCIYAFNYSELEAYGLCKKKAYFEEFEDIEILRFLDLGIKVKMVETSTVSLAVDVPSDVEKVEHALKNLR